MLGLVLGLCLKGSALLYERYGMSKQFFYAEPIYQKDCLVIRERKYTSFCLNVACMEGGEKGKPDSHGRERLSHNLPHTGRGQ